MKTYTVGQVNKILNVAVSINRAENALKNFVESGIDLSKASTRKTCRILTSKISKLEFKKTALLNK